MNKAGCGVMRQMPEPGLTLRRECEVPEYTAWPVSCLGCSLGCKIRRVTGKLIGSGKSSDQSNPEPREFGNSDFGEKCDF